MKKIFSLLAVLIISYTAKSQTGQVEQSTFGIQTGFIGLWIHNESKLSDQITLRSELGFDSGFWGGSFYDKAGFIMTPQITLEPRWYYNLNKRTEQSKRIDFNSGNFIALKTSYHPDWFVISNYDDINVISAVSVIPTWGIRRNLGNHFNYEAGLGFGYRYIFAKQAGFLNNESEAAVNLHLRIGYIF